MGAQPARELGRAAARAFVVVVASAAFLIPAPHASAYVRGPCNGRVTIAGRTFTPANDTEANPIRVPKRTGLTADWEGRTTVLITDHSGSVAVTVGPRSVTIGRWASPNGSRLTEKSGSESIDSMRGKLPVDIAGIYEVTGRHSGRGGSCSGMVKVCFEGGPFSTGLGLAGVVAAAVSFAVMLLGAFLARRGRRGGPALAAIFGAVSGLLIAFILQQACVHALDNLAVFGAPLAGLALGLALGYVGKRTGAA